MRLALVLAATGALGACTEKLDTRAACPALCPNQDVTIRDTTVDVIVLDTTLAGFPAKGAEDYLLVANRGAELDTRAVVRFDSLQRTFDRSATETGIRITSLTTAWLRLTVDTTNSTFTAPVTVNVYDIDTPELYPTDAAVVARFGSAPLLGSRTFAARADVKDSLTIPLDVAAIAARISGDQRIRLGLQVTSAAPVELRVNATTGVAGTAPLLNYDPTDSTDAIKAITVAARSSVPAVSAGIAFNMRDYTVVLAGQQPVTPDVLAVGGLPARRVYLRFVIPPALLDSTTIVRATLLLTQRASAGPSPSAAVTLVPLLGLAGKDVTEPGRAALLVSPPGFLGLGSVSLTPASEGQRGIDIGPVIRNWTTATFGDNPRAIVLRLSGEGYVPGELRFYSQEAADAAVRPRLRLNYVPRLSFGVP